jgi:hypothetical protein
MSVRFLALRASLREKKEGGRCTGEAKVVVNSDGLPTSKRCSPMAFLREKTERRWRRFCRRGGAQLGGSKPGLQLALIAGRRSRATVRCAPGQGEGEGGVRALTGGVRAPASGREKEKGEGVPGWLGGLQRGFWAGLWGCVRFFFFVLRFPFIFSVFPFMQFSNQLKNNSDKFLKIPIRYQCKAILKEIILSLFLFDKTLSKIKMCRVY